MKKPEPAKTEAAAANATPPATRARAGEWSPTREDRGRAAKRRAAARAAAGARAARRCRARRAAKGGPIAVQVGAYRERGEADQLAKKLSGKGYAVYIVSPDANAANPMFRVRVGNYTSQDEASRVKRRLEQEEKLKPWIIR